MNKTPIKIDEASLSEIKMLQGKFQEITLKLGNLQVEKMELDQMVSNFVEKEKRLKEEWQSLKKLDQSLHDRIVDTYGEGGINMADGMFIPMDAASPPK